MISDICNTSRGGMLQSTDTLLLYLCWLFSVFLLWCETNKQFIGICSLDFSGIFDLLEYLFLWKLFTFHDYISSQISALSTPYIFQTDYHSSFIAFEMIIFHHSTRHGITRLISTVHIMHNRHSETKQRKKQDRTDMGRKRVLVSCNCRDLSALHSYSSPPQLAGSGQFTNPKCWYLTVWEWDSTTNYLCGVFRISSDKSSFKFNCFDLSKYVLDKYSGDPRTLQDTT